MCNLSHKGLNLPVEMRMIELLKAVPVATNF